MRAIKEGHQRPPVEAAAWSGSESETRNGGQLPRAPEAWAQVARGGGPGGAPDWDVRSGMVQGWNWRIGTAR